tara:strand:+ start:1012 stop:1293 length:282 start_codon:yes stop_codon:yes gene_type:complete
MNSENDKLKEILNTVLDIFDKNDVSPEDGAFLSANLLASAIGSLDPKSIESILTDVLSHKVMPTSFRSSNHPFTIVGADRGWGLDPALIDEEH